MEDQAIQDTIDMLGRLMLDEKIDFEGVFLKQIRGWGRAQFAVRCELGKVLR